MMTAPKHGLLTSATLHSEGWREAEQLVSLSNQFEGIALPLTPELPPLSETDQNQFFYYEQGRMLGFAAIQQEGLEPEASGVVHPHYRRRGISRLLLAAVLETCRRRGYEQLLLICDGASLSGRAFVTAVGAHYQSAEYQMVLDSTTIDRSRPRPEGLEFEAVGVEAFDLLVYLQQGAFGDPEEAVREHVGEGLQQPTRQYFVARLQGEPIGLLRLGRYDRFADITAFGVLPQYRGRGYGRQMLLDAVDRLLAETWPQILIDVATDNQNALGLYQSCGFRVIRTYNYYSLTIEQ